MSKPAAPRVLYVAEPAAVWQLRPPVVADCSVLAAVLFDEPSRDAAAALLAGKSLHAPTLLPFELANVAVKKQRAGAADVAMALADFSDQRIELHPVTAEASFELAQRHGLSAYDAAYLWLAAELNAPLATFDSQLGKAAQRHLGMLE